LRHARFAALILLLLVAAGVYVTIEQNTRRVLFDKNSELSRALSENQQLLANQEAQKNARTLLVYYLGMALSDGHTKTPTVIAKPQTTRPWRGNVIQPGATIFGVTRGTACCMVSDTRGGPGRYMLSSVLSTGGQGTKVFEVAPAGRLRQIGEVSNSVHTSVIALTPGLSVTNIVPTRGPMRQWTKRPKAGDPIYMLGTVSGLVKGEVVSATYNYIVTNIAAEEEDMGGPLLNERNELVGVMWQTGGSISMAMSMEEIEESRHVKLITEP
jgi:hypothetical protein